MKRISVTTLEKFRRYLFSCSPFDTEEALIESIKGLFTGNDKTKFGGAYHQVMEGDFTFDSYGNEPVVRAGDFVFTWAQAKAALEYRASHPSMIYETSVSKIYESKYGPIQVTGRIDGIEGKSVRDGKTKFRPVTTSEYMDSSQWKFYLDMEEMDHFYYDVFEVRGFIGLDEKAPYHVNCVIIDPIEIPCLRYEEMSQEIVSQLNSFLDYIDARQLHSFLKPAQTETIKNKRDEIFIL